MTHRFSTAKRTSQRGLTLMSTIAVMAVLGFLFLLGARSIPAWNEYHSIKKAVQTLEASGIQDTTDIRRKFDERSSLEYITTLKGADLQVTKVGSGVKIDFDYEKRIPLFGNAYLVFEFSSL